MQVKDYNNAYLSYMKASEMDSAWIFSHNKANKAKELIAVVDSVQVE